jgi:hypothetical protein
VTAFAPVSGQPAGMYIGLPECAGSMVADLHPADPAVIGAARIDTGDRDRHAAIRETFYGDVDDITANAAIGLLSPDAPVGIPLEAFTVTPGRFGAIPHTYVTCAKDNAIPIALQRRFVEEIDAISSMPTAVVELDSSHSPFLSQPTALATAIADAASN